MSVSVSTKRIQSFLDSKEKSTTFSDENNNENNGVNVKSASFVWDTLIKMKQNTSNENKSTYKIDIGYFFHLLF